MSKTRELTCIVCPRGCQIRVTLSENGAVEEVAGYTCKRGLAYAQDECTHPKRTVTSTVRCEDGEVVSVKTESSIPKEKVFAAMKEINSVRAKNRLSIGDVVLENVAGTGVNVIATSNK